MRSAVAAVLTAGVVLSACALFADLGGLSDGRMDLDADIEPRPLTDSGAAEEGSDAPDAEHLSDGGLDAEAGEECKGSKGPAPVRVGSYCIDSTEVTNADYDEFLAAKAGDTSGQPSECSWNVSFTREFGGPKDGPVRAVDWCDALAYCTWAGKRLCGRVGGGPTPLAVLSNPAASEWFRACSHDGTRAYPYGGTRDANACNTYGGSGPAPVGSFPECEGGYPGLFDMSGNLWEWEDACEDVDGGSRCVLRGGSYAANNNGACATTAKVRRDRGTTSDITIRCCSDLN